MKCTSCNERKGNTRCEECNTLFCLPCMNKHHDELAQQFQQLMDARNEIKQSLDISRSTSSNEKQIPFLVEIDKWEREIIQHIHEIAVKVRINAKELMTKHMNEISDRFEQISIHMQQRQKEGDYLENGIERVKNQLEELKNDIKRVNETVRVDSTGSNNIEWDTLIYIVEKDLSSKATSESVSDDNKFVNSKKTYALSRMAHGSENVDGSPLIISTSKRRSAKTSELNSIPIQITQSNPSTNSSKQDIDRSESCIICKQPLNATAYKIFCDMCDYALRRDVYASTYENADTSDGSAVPKTKT